MANELVVAARCGGALALTVTVELPLTAAPKDVINVLTHEICHLKNRDHLWALLRIVCCVLHWFNPLVWIAANMSRTDTELRCDDRVTAPMNQEQKQAYANILVLASSRRNAPGVAVLATGMTMTGRRLKTRVLTVLQGVKPLRWLSVVFMIYLFNKLTHGLQWFHPTPVQN